MGGSWEGIQNWPIPRMGVHSQQLSEGPRPAREAQARSAAVAVGQASLRAAGDKLLGWAEAPCTHNRRYLQTQQGLAVGQGFQGQASIISRESSGVIKLARPDEKAGRSGCRATTSLFLAA